MKFLVKVTLPVNEANDAILDGSIVDKLRRIVEDTRPEAVYFGVENGQRTQYLIVNIENAAQMPAVTEPWWLMFNADLDITPIFTMADMEEVGPALGTIVKKWGTG